MKVPVNFLNRECETAFSNFLACNKTHKLAIETENGYSSITLEQALNLLGDRDCTVEYCGTNLVLCDFGSLELDRVM